MKLDFSIKPFHRTLAMLLATTFVAACANLSPSYEQPLVSLSYFRPVSQATGSSENPTGNLPAFEVGLHILNPNRQALDLEGVVYTINIQGQDIIKGVGKGYAPIEGYGEGEITLTAVPNLLAGVRLLGNMMSKPTEALEYEFEAKLDVGSFYPRIKVKEAGSFDLSGAQAQ